MGYATLSDLLALLPEETLVKLSNDQGGASVVDSSNIEAAIAQADRIIDGYVGMQRSVPLEPVPELIRIISANLAVCHLYRRRNQLPEIWESQYKADLVLLGKIAMGQLSFGADSKPAEPPQQTLAHSSRKTLGGAGGLLEGY